MCKCDHNFLGEDCYFCKKIILVMLYVEYAYLNLGDNEIKLAPGKYTIFKINS
jgi:hypothetical protein